MESKYTRQLQDILSTWDFWELQRELEAGRGPIAQLPTIPAQFASADDYIRVFEPLLLEEAAAQLMRGQEEGTVVTSQPGVVAAATAHPDGTVTVRLTLPPGVSGAFSENDLLLLSRDRPEDEEGEELLHALGFVEGHEGDQSLAVRFRLGEDSQVGNERGLKRVRAMRSALSKEESQWWALKLSNMSTILREWAAVHCISHLPLREVLLSAKPAKSLMERGALEVPPRMRAAMEGAYNGSQMEAVTSGLDGSQVMLVQGPPGTGKTKTILGLLAIVMHSAPKGAFSAHIAPAARASSRRGRGGGDGGGATSPRSGRPSFAERRAQWIASTPWLCGTPDPRDVIVPAEEADSGAAFGLLRKDIARRIGKEEGPKARILVCAPSNSALDEIVLRLVNTGLFDAEGRPFTPNVVRVGVNIHHSVQSVALDTLVQHRLGGSGAGVGISRGERDRLRLQILEEASIVCTTLSFSGSGTFARLARKFDVVVIDEAAQAVEPSTLVPLAHGGAKQVYLVGDPVQLPATVMSRRAIDKGYSESLFKRLQGAGYPVHMLDTQYRMHPAIREFPSMSFYAGSLRDGPTIAEDTKAPWHASPAFKPLVFLDVRGKETSPEGSSSLVNNAEAEVVLTAYRELTHRHAELRGRPAVAVISPYKAQVSLLRSAFKDALGNDSTKMVDINSIDGFQGREKEVAIFSTVRSGKHGKGIGFVADERRINVGLTRARKTLIIVGNASALKGDHHWGALISHARRQGCMYKAQKPYAEWLGRLADGLVAPEAPLPEDSDEFVPQAEPGAHDDADFSDDDVPTRLQLSKQVSKQQKRRPAAEDAEAVLTVVQPGSAAPTVAAVEATAKRRKAK